MANVVVLNGEKVNYDQKLDWHSIAADIEVYESSTPAQIVERAQGATILVTKELAMPGDLIRRLPDSIQMIVEAGTGYNNFDMDALKERQIALTNIPEYSTQRVAATAIMLMLNLASSMQTQLKMLAEGDHANFDQHLMVNHVELNGKTLGVVGYGHIGRAVIKVAQAMEMNILVATRTPREDIDGIHFTNQADLFAQSDFISLHLPLTAATQHMVNAELLKTMKPTAFLINTARGGLVDEAALIDALQQNVIAGAGLDVQEVEPLPDDSSLFTLPNAIVTPHMGWRGLETRQRLIKMVGDNIAAFEAHAPINQVG